MEVIDEWSYFTNSDPEVWVTNLGERVHIDDMSNQHVRNALKLILRKAHEGKIWAISPLTGGLRHYNKGASQMAKVTVKKEEPKPVNKWDTVESVILVLDKNEAKYLRDLIGDQPYDHPHASTIYQAFVQQGFNHG